MAKKNKNDDFQAIPSIPDSKMIIEQCFKTMKKSRLMLRSKKYSSPHARERAMAKDSVRTFSKTAYNMLSNILLRYPDIDSFSMVHKKLMGLEYDNDTVKKSLGRLKGSLPQVRRFERQYMGKMRMHLEENEYNKHKDAAIARISSTIGKLDDALLLLESYRRTLRELPMIKDSMRVCAIAGFPNVGKSTLLSKLTDAKPVIDSYPFTTKGLNLGILTNGSISIQLIDTPGTLDRDNANIIERRAQIIMEYSADIIVFVYDPMSNYGMEKQVKLYDRIANMSKGKKLLFFVSKSDIANNPMEGLPSRIVSIAIKDPIRVSDAIFRMTT
ncbi:MAG: GTPase [Candidatus Woesearchaeota archaeon]